MWSAQYGTQYRVHRPIQICELSRAPVPRLQCGTKGRQTGSTVGVIVSCGLHSIPGGCHRRVHILLLPGTGKPVAQGRAQITQADGAGDVVRGGGSDNALECFHRFIEICHLSGTAKPTAEGRGENG